MSEGMNVGTVGGIGKALPSQSKPAGGVDGAAFKDVLFGKIDEVNSLQKASETAMTNFAEGKTENISEMFVAVQKADLAFKTLMSIRNKLMEAYDEINQLRV